MTNQDRMCSRCGGKLLDGFLADFHTKAVAVTCWVNGEPEPCHGFTPAVIRVSPERCVPIKTYCCQDCGAIETFADSIARVRETKAGHQPVEG